jgi:hypothetical protein
MDLARLELTHIWSKGPMYLAPGQGILALRSRIHRNQGPIISKLRMLSYPGVCARLCAIYLSIRQPHTVRMHDATDEWRSEQEGT